MAVLFPFTRPYFTLRWLSLPLSLVLLWNTLGNSQPKCP